MRKGNILQIEFLPRRFGSCHNAKKKVHKICKSDNNYTTYKWAEFASPITTNSSDSGSLNRLPASSCNTRDFSWKPPFSITSNEINELHLCCWQADFERDRSSLCSSLEGLPSSRHDRVPRDCKMKSRTMSDDAACKNISLHNILLLFKMCKTCTYFLSCFIKKIWMIKKIFKETGLNGNNNLRG